MSEEKAPGKETVINGIPTAIITDHNEAYFYFQKAKLKWATLLHIDGHDDMGWAPLVDGIMAHYKTNIFDAEKNYYKALGIADFICPAVYYGMISKVYWLNPHSKNKQLQYMGDIHDEERSLETKLICLNIFEDKIEPLTEKSELPNIRICWKSPYLKPKHKKEGEVIFLKDKRFSENLKIKWQPFILDIDLDAFCCDKDVCNVSPFYIQNKQGIKNYEVRLNDSIELLKKLKRKPDLIIISRSQGQEVGFRRFRLDSINMDYYRKSQSFVPEELVKKIEKNLISGLDSIY